jgi:carbamoyltransferase
VTKPIYILGISGFYHDSAAALIRDGDVVAAVQEERFTRKKGEARFPIQSIRYCLDEAGIGVDALCHVVFHEKPWVHFERLLETHLAYAPRGLFSFLRNMPPMIQSKLWIRKLVQRELDAPDLSVLFCEHHESHMAAAFYPSPFERAAVLTVDGVGEWATTRWGTGRGSDLQVKGEISFPHSLGLLYSAFTQYLGFQVNRGEYKVMGLAPYGEPIYAETILEELVELRDDGSFRLNMKYFSYPYGGRMIHRRMEKLFGTPTRVPETALEKIHLDLAASIQTVCEEILLKIVSHVHKETGEKSLCLGGGVALNCVANGRILRESGFTELWIQPAAGDSGSALGAAWAVWYQYLGIQRTRETDQDDQHGSYLGPSYSNDEIQAFLDAVGARYARLEDQDLPAAIAESVANQEVVGCFRGRMEFGPRALGHRSILADARSETMQRTLNQKIKKRESFRPFAPMILEEEVRSFFEISGPSPYMLLVAPVVPEKRVTLSQEDRALLGLDMRNAARTEIPAVTHVDFSARIQTVHQERQPVLHAVLRAFQAQTGCPLMINTSFNVRGEPIVCTALDAYRCFQATDMDTLYLENFRLLRAEQGAWAAEEWTNEKLGWSP